MIGVLFLPKKALEKKNFFVKPTVSSIHLKSKIYDVKHFHTLSRRGELGWMGQCYINITIFNLKSTINHCIHKYDSERSSMLIIRSRQKKK